MKSVTRPTLAVVVSNQNVVGSLRAKPDSMEVFQGIARASEVTGEQEIP